MDIFCHFGGVMNDRQCRGPRHCRGTVPKECLGLGFIVFCRVCAWKAHTEQVTYRSSHSSVSNKALGLSS